MNRTKGILAAASLTGLILITMLALGFGGLQAQPAVNTPAEPALQVSVPAANGSVDDATLRAWQDYSTRLEQTVRVLQERDTAYQQQLEASNQTILQLQDQINRGGSSHAEHEEHEHEEHEAFEFGEFDD